MSVGTILDSECTTYCDECISITIVCVFFTHLNYRYTNSLEYIQKIILKMININRVKIRPGFLKFHPKFVIGGAVMITLFFKYSNLKILSSLVKFTSTKISEKKYMFIIHI